MSDDPWVPVCGDCYYLVEPDQYMPERPFTEYADTCTVCGLQMFNNNHLRKSQVDEYLNTPVNDEHTNRCLQSMYGEINV